MRLSRCPFSILFVLLSGCLYRSPGVLHESATEPLRGDQVSLREQLKRDVHHLSATIGPRNASEDVARVLAAEKWIIKRLAASGIRPSRDEVSLGGVNVANVEASFSGTKLPDEVLVIGGHYDTVVGSPGANDNASGVAMLLWLAERLAIQPPERTIRVLFFVNEEWPFSCGVQMGSKVYAERCKARGDHIVAMICVDGVGCYSSDAGSQRYPPLVGWSLPKKANFIAFGSDMKNRWLLDRVVAAFQTQSRFPSIGAAMDSPMMARSDHAPFWWQGYPAVSMSDTAEFRDSTYHQPTDTPEHLNYDEMARLAEGFVATIHVLASEEITLSSSID